MKRKHYFHSCVDWPRADVENLSEMIDNASDITRETFIKNVDAEGRKNLEYSLGYGSFFYCKNDWAVSYSKSKLHGKTVYFMNHSMIEYVFI